MFYMTLPLKRYFQFNGRSRRKEYWMYFLLVLIGSVIASVLDVALGLGGSYTGTTSTTGGLSTNFNMQGGVLAVIWGLANAIPGLAVGIRRLHDTDRSGWWILINLIPLVGFIVWIIFMCTDGTPGANRFGSDPKQDETSLRYGRTAAR